MSSKPSTTGCQQQRQNNSKNTEENDSSDDEQENEFFDASCEPSDDFISFEMDLETALDESKLAIHYFFNNKFDEARTLLKPFASTSMYHAMGHAVFSFLEAVLTFEQRHIDTAAAELKHCLEICQRHRKRNTITETIGKKFKRSNFSQMTDIEAHAELCAAEVLLLKALLTFIEDETLTSLIRGSLRVRQCYSSYKDCAEILKQRQWHSTTSKVHFESGVRMGIGTFNVMISLLPAGIIKVLEFIGFSSNKAAGLNDLVAGYKMNGLRQVLCALTLLGYHLIVCYVLGHQEGDLQLCDTILEEQLVRYPNGVWFLFFKGRLQFMQGDLSGAASWYKKSWQSQQVWPQFHHLSYWELLWVECLKQNWRGANIYATYLVEKSKWSRTIYSYQKAAVMLMLDDSTALERQSIEDLIRKAPLYKQRIAGKSLPMEKFVLKKVARYFAQNKTLCFPVIELMYLWNTFKVFRKNLNAAEKMLHVLNHQLIEFEMANTAMTNEEFFYDNRALCLLLRGAIFRQLRKPELAMSDLSDCIALQNSIKDDNYLVPYASVEAALVEADEQRIEQAITMLEYTKKKYTGFSLESRLHFRIHAALMELKAKK